LLQHEADVTFTIGMNLLGVFGQVFGFAGLLIALPASAVLLVALRKLRARYLESDLYSGHR